MKAHYIGIVVVIAALGGALYINYAKPLTAVDTTSDISFNHDIRPILNKNCTGCHGGVGKQANVSFIYRDEALGRGHSGRLTIVPGKPDASELIARVESTDPNVRMPYKGAPLPPEEIRLLRDWIEQGADWEEHWAFVKPELQTPSEVNNKKLISNPIDSFIQAKLESQNLSMAPRAEKTALLRRLTLDLTGLAPTLDEVESFLADDSPQAFENQVDRLLLSPRYGERWAAMWMDLARYADSWGFTRDEERDVWPYKRWVIDNFNNNTPFDEFVTEQIAGDLMPNRNLDQLIATSFHRQTPANSEGGTDDEEYRLMAVMDRSATTWSVLNAMTMNCVQCHSHPYDPIEHEEYYKSLSYFNTTLDADFREYAPLYKLAKDETQKSRAFELQEQMLLIAREEAQKAHQLAQQTSASTEPWKKIHIESALGHEVRALKVYEKWLESFIQSAKEAGEKPNSRKMDLLKVTQERIKTLRDSGEEVRTQTVKNGEFFEEGSFEARVIFQLNAKKVEAPTTITSLRFSAVPQNPDKAKHTPEKPFYLDDIKIYVAKAGKTKKRVAVETYFANATEVMDTQLTALANLKTNEERRYKGAANGWFAHRLFVPRWTVAVLDEPLQLGIGDRLEFEIDQTQKVVPRDALPNRIHRVRIEATNHSGWNDYAMSERRQSQIETYNRIKQELEKIEGYMLPVMLEQEPWNQREMALFSRGNFISKIGDKILPGTPAVFPSNDQPQNRLGLASWFFEPDQPLTSRVTVNRFWHRLFGTGIVKTLEDFGSAGTLPSHPELLDWLAIEFQKNMDWDVKALLKLMVMSHAYQQESKVSRELFDMDPDNELFARGPRQRLTAEMIRDQALAASELISHKQVDEPAMPPQPGGIWGHPGVKFKDWTEDTNEGRYRRAIYTFVKRAFMYPSFLTFDMETREISHERRIATNTPLQALVTLNDPVYHEAAQALGEIMHKKANAESPSKAISHGYKRVVSREPNPYELENLLLGYNELKKEAQTEQKPEFTDNVAWTAIASVLLNLDAALTR